jgi:hypothetical protein
MSNGCGANEHWDEGAGCCVPNGTEEIQMLASDVTFAAIRRVLTRGTKDERERRFKSTEHILKATLKKLTADLPHGKKTTQF